MQKCGYHCAEHLRRWKKLKRINIPHVSSNQCWRLHVPCKASDSSVGYILLSPFAWHNLFTPCAWYAISRLIFSSCITRKTWYAPIHRRLTLRMRGGIGRCSWRALLLARVGYRSQQWRWNMTPSHHCPPYYWYYLLVVLEPHSALWKSSSSNVFSASWQ